MQLGWGGCSINTKRHHCQSRQEGEACFQYRRMPLGLTLATSAFQRMMCSICPGGLRVSTLQDRHDCVESKSERTLCNQRSCYGGRKVRVLQKKKQLLTLQNGYCFTTKGNQTMPDLLPSHRENCLFSSSSDLFPSGSKQGLHSSSGLCPCLYKHQSQTFQKYQEFSE